MTVVELILEDDIHHHHLFCSDCGEIIDIEMGDEFEKTLSEEIKRIEVQESNIIGQNSIRVVFKPTKEKLIIAPNTPD